MSRGTPSASKIKFFRTGKVRFFGVPKTNYFLPPRIIFRSKKLQIMAWDGRNIYVRCVSVCFVGNSKKSSLSLIYQLVSYMYR